MATVVRGPVASPSDEPAKSRGAAGPQVPVVPPQPVAPSDHPPEFPKFPAYFALPAPAERLTEQILAANLRRGEVTERSKVPDSKSGVPERVPGVRIPSSP